MIKIYHNPRCSKSRQGLAILENAKVQFEIIKYLDTPPTYIELEDMLKKMNKKPIEIVRIKEAIWKENFKGKELSEKQIIEAMVQFPKLIERPIVVNGNKVALGRPPELIARVLK
jgi:arsenate reductase